MTRANAVAVSFDDRGTARRAAREAGRLGGAVPASLARELDALTTAFYRETQEAVGVESGALKASGRSGSELRDDGDTWVGYVAYGDGTAPVDYALFHLADNEPWFAGATATEAAMEEAILAHFRRRVAGFLA